MSLGSKINLGLLLAVALLALINWLEPGIGDDYPLVTLLSPEQINSIKLTHQGKPRFSLKRGADGWRDSEGEGQQANRDRVEKLLQISQLPSLYRFPVNQADLKQYGLQPPGYQLQFNQVELQFGGNDPVSQLRYLKVDDTIHLVSDGYYHHLNRSPFDKPPAKISFLSEKPRNWRKSTSNARFLRYSVLQPWAYSEATMLPPDTPTSCSTPYPIRSRAVRIPTCAGRRVPPPARTGIIFLSAMGLLAAIRRIPLRDRDLQPGYLRLSGSGNARAG